ncbi:alpha/beta hydrolase fold domain-containing protein [Altererythrobacter sp. MF3-039]|uniref:alpha/beta hydrolase fold domain-containing protein n=1 Tax=Altererythrobacter sp. MF3-039 TaxID=3252901 RepID=UPI00390CC5CE
MAESEIFELRSSKPSLLMKLGKWLITRGPKVFPQAEEEVAPFLDGRDIPPDAELSDKIAKRFEVEQWECEGQQCVTLHPLTGRGEQHILYFHGGGFVLPMLDAHWPLVAALVDATGASLTVPLYDVVPESCYSAADRLADGAFARITRDWAPEKVTLCGDSAGGHMALALALRQVRAGSPKAGKLALFAPWLDLTLADPAIQAVEADDIMLRIRVLRPMGKAWAGGRDPASPECSPLYASREELAQLPPTAVFVGRHDLFVVDCRTFAAKMINADNAPELYEYAGAPHVYMALPFTREAKDTFRLVDQFMKA